MIILEIEKLIYENEREINCLQSQILELENRLLDVLLLRRIKDDLEIKINLLEEFNSKLKKILEKKNEMFEL